MLQVWPVAQSDPRWRKAKLGEGTRTIGQSGCLLACLAMAEARASQRPPMRLDALSQALVDDGAFAGSGLVWASALTTLGLAGAVRTYDQARAGAELAAGRLVVVGLDYKPGRSSGVSDADHFAVLVEQTGTYAAILDPATGTLVRIANVASTYNGKRVEFAEMRTVSAVRDLRAWAYPVARVEAANGP
jgi:hypothetical protein